MNNHYLSVQDHESDNEVVLYERTFFPESRRVRSRSEGSCGLDDCPSLCIERTRHRESTVRYRRVDRIFRSSIPDFATRTVTNNSAERKTLEIKNLSLSQNAPFVQNSTGHNTQRSFPTPSAPNETSVHSSQNRDTEEGATPALLCNTPAGGNSADVNSHKYNNLDMTSEPAEGLPTIHIDNEAAQNGKFDSNGSVVFHSQTEDSITEGDTQVPINLDITSDSRPVNLEPGSSTNEEHLEQDPESPSNSLTVLDSEYNTMEKSPTNSQAAHISANIKNVKGVADDAICDLVPKNISVKNNSPFDLVSPSSLLNNKTEKHLEQNLYPESLSDFPTTDSSPLNISEEGIIVEEVPDTYIGDSITEQVRHLSEDLGAILHYQFLNNSAGRKTEESIADYIISHASSRSNTTENFQQELQLESSRNSPGICSSSNTNSESRHTLTEPDSSETEFKSHTSNVNGLSIEDPKTDSTATVTVDFPPAVNSQSSSALASSSHCSGLDNVNTQSSGECSGNTPETNRSDIAASMDKHSGEDMLDVAPSNSAGVGSAAGNSSTILLTPGSPSHYPLVVNSSNMTSEEGFEDTLQSNNISSEEGSTISLDLGSSTDSNSLRGTSQISLSSSGSVASTTFINPAFCTRHILSSVSRASSSTDSSSQDSCSCSSQSNRPLLASVNKKRNEIQENMSSSKIFSRSRTPLRDSSSLVVNDLKPRNNSMDRAPRRALSPAVCAGNCHVEHSCGRRARSDSLSALRDPYQPTENRRSRNTSPPVGATQRNRTPRRRLSPAVRAPYVNLDYQRDQTSRRELSPAVGAPYSDVEYTPRATPRRELSPAVGVSHQCANNPRSRTLGRDISQAVAAPYSRLWPARRGLSPCVAAGCPRVNYSMEQTIQSDASAASTASRSRRSRSRSRRGRRNSSPAIVSNTSNSAPIVQSNNGIPVTPVLQTQLQPQVQPIYQTAQVLQAQYQTEQIYQPHLQGQPVYTQQLQPQYQLQYDVSQQALQPQYQIYQPQIEAQPNLQQAFYQQQFQPIQEFQLQAQPVLQPQLKTQPVKNRRDIPMPTVVTEKRPTPAKKDGVSVMRLETAKSWCIENYPFHDEWLGIPPDKNNILARTTLDYLVHTDVRFASMNYCRFQGGLFNYNVKNVLEFSNFHDQFRTDDILTLFREYTDKVLVKWVDDSHALLVFKDVADADRVMSIYNGIGTLRNLIDSSKISKFVAVKCGFVTKGGIV